MDGNTVKIAIGSDHAGVKTKAFLIEKLQREGFILNDFGTFTEESMDYPDVAHPLAHALAKGDFSVGILLCGSGNGVAMVANKYPEIRAAICWNRELTVLARQHNDANILVLPARFISEEDALELAMIFLNTGFEGGRHQRRVDKIAKML